MRDDVASVATRQVPISRPNDEQVRIPGNGFVLVGTLSKPAEPGATRLPAVVLVGGSGPTDRDEIVFGIPIFGQLADALADAGFIVLRYDKRGVGQSGGRDEAATLADYADDVRAAVKFLSQRKDVDPKRIAVVGHGEGGIGGDAGGGQGQAHRRARARGDDRRHGRRAQSGAGEARARSHQSIRRRQAGDDRAAEADPAGGPDRHRAGNRSRPYRAAGRHAVVPELPRVRSGEVMPDSPAAVARSSRASSTRRLRPPTPNGFEALATQRKNAPPVQVVKVPGVNHLLVPATTGEVDEYPTLKDKRVSAEVSGRDRGLAARRSLAK